MFFSHLPKDGIADKTIKLVHHLAQTPPTYWNDSQNKKIVQCMNMLIQLKESGSIAGGRPCGLQTCWTIKKSELEKHTIGNIIGKSNQFKVFSDIICKGTVPSMHEAIIGIKRSSETILGAMESMIEVPLDVYKHEKFSPMFDYAQAWITSRFDLICGLKNTESKLELFHFKRYDDEDLLCGKRRTISFPQRMFVDGKASEICGLHQFGQMCFTTNRDQATYVEGQPL